jgi:hypothetical protein
VTQTLRIFAARGAKGKNILPEYADAQERSEGMTKVE